MFCIVRSSREDEVGDCFQENPADKRFTLNCIFPFPSTDYFSYLVHGLMDLFSRALLCILSSCNECIFQIKAFFASYYKIRYKSEFLFSSAKLFKSILEYLNGDLFQFVLGAHLSSQKQMGIATTVANFTFFWYLLLQSG